MGIYLDYNATTPLLPAALEATCQALAADFGNPSSVHTYGQRAKALLDDARGDVARLIGAEPADVVFTAGGTEADNFALRGAAEALEHTGRRRILSTGIEHEAVLATLKALERRGWTVAHAPVDARGIVDLNGVADLLTDDTALVSVMLANNEVGTIQPVREIAALARARGALVHTDAVQAVGKIPIAVRDLGVDLLALAGHKIGGPKGTGALWIRRGVRLLAQATGGRQERNRRAGTENVPALAGLGAAARAAHAAVAAGLDDLRARRDRFEAAVLATVPDTHVNGDRVLRVPNTTNIGFHGVEAESLLIALDLEGVAVSTGSACSSGSLEPSHVLAVMGLPSQHTRSAIRFSLGPGTTDADLDTVLAMLPGLVTRLRRLSRTAAALR